MTYQLKLDKANRDEIRLRTSADNRCKEFLWRHSNPPSSECDFRHTIPQHDASYATTISPQTFRVDRSELAWLCNNVYPNKSNTMSDQRQNVNGSSFTALDRQSETSVNGAYRGTPNVVRINSDKDENFGACIFTVIGVPKGFDDTPRNELYSPSDRRKPVDTFPHVTSSLERYGRRHKYVDEKTVNSHGNSSGGASSLKSLHKTNRVFRSVYRMERELLLGDAPTDVLQHLKLIANSHREGQRVLCFGKNVKDRRLGTGPSKEHRGHRFRTVNDSPQINDPLSNLPLKYNTWINPTGRDSIFTNFNLNGTLDRGYKEKSQDPDPDVCVDEEPTLSVAELKIRFLDCAKPPVSSKIKNSESFTKCGERSERQNLNKNGSKPFINRQSNNPVMQLTKSNSQFREEARGKCVIETAQIDPVFVHQKSILQSTKPNRPAQIIETATETRKSNTISQAVLPHQASQSIAVNTLPFTAKDLDFGWIDDDDVLCDDFYAGNQSTRTARELMGNHRTRHAGSGTCSVTEEEDEGDDSDESNAAAYSYFERSKRSFVAHSPFLSPNVSESGRTDITDNSLDAMVGVNQCVSVSFVPEMTSDPTKFGQHRLRTFGVNDVNNDQLDQLKIAACRDSFTRQTNTVVINADVGVSKLQVSNGKDESDEKQCTIKELVETFEGLTNQFMRTGSFRKYARIGIPSQRF